MVAHVASRPANEPQYIGMRCSAAEFFALEDDGFRYQLIDGVVLMSPRPTPRHQRLLLELLGQLRPAARRAGGVLLPKVDLCLGGDIVYSPDALYIAPGRAFSDVEAISIVPDLVIEIISPGSRRMDLKTKRDDYEKFGVREYWVFEPDERRARLYRLQGGAYVETICQGATAASEAIPGFTFDLTAVWASIQA